MPSSSKSKGNRGEREVAAKLSKLFNLNFERVPNSGAFTGGKNSVRIGRLTKSQQLLTEGDLIVPDELYGMTVECKTYKKFSWNQLYSSCKQLDDWIEQASNTDKVWFLTFKINYCNTCVVFAKDRVPAYPKWKLPDSHQLYKKDYIICDFDTFFEMNVTNVLQVCKNQL